MPATLREVAAAAGTSLATASRAVGGGVCAEATRARVLAAARRLGWRPDPGLARLIERRWRPQHTGNLVVQLYESAPPLPTGWADDLRALRSAARRRGWSVHAEAIEAHPDGAALGQHLHQLGALAVAVGLMHAPGYDLTPVWRSFPAVALGAASHRPAIPLVSSDDWARAKAAWTWLVEQGWTRIGVALPDWPEAWSVALRRSALRDGWCQLADPIPWCAHPLGDVRPVLPWVRQHRPEVILVHDPPTAVMLRQLGIDLPIACLVTFSEQDRHTWPGSYFDRGAVAAAGLDLLGGQVRAGVCGAEWSGMVQLVDMPYGAPA